MGLVASTKVVGQTSGWHAGTSEGFGVAKLKIRRQIWDGPLEKFCLRNATTVETVVGLDAAAALSLRMSRAAAKLVAEVSARAVSPDKHR